MQTDRRSAKTREQLERAFVELLAERVYEDLSVSDIAERANVGRSTFYCHFRDKDELTVWYFSKGIESFAQQLNLAAAEEEEMIPLQTLCANVRQCSQLAATLHRSKKVGAIYSRLTRLLTTAYAQRLRSAPCRRIDSPSIELIAKLVAVQTMNAIRHWIDEGMTMPPKQFSETVHSFVRPGLLRILDREVRPS